MTHTFSYSVNLSDHRTFNRLSSYLKKIYTSINASKIVRKKSEEQKADDWLMHIFQKPI